MDKPSSWRLDWVQAGASPARVDAALQAFWAGSAEEIEGLSGGANPPTGGTCQRIDEAIRAIQARYEGGLVAWVKSRNWLR